MSPWNNNTLVNTTVVSSPASHPIQQTPGTLQPIPKRPTDPNLTDSRLLVHRKCIYERRLPGNAYITAHVERLQHGYFSSPIISGRDIDHVDFLAVNFVFHPSDCRSHRFKAATIKASIQNLDAPFSKDEQGSPCLQENPRFLMYAPHLIYGAESPETLQWNFSLAGSLGISDAPVVASLSPSGSVRGQYELYEMMKIQGSVRTLKSPYGPEFYVEDGEIFWSLTENPLLRSGLPREFTFVMLVQKPSWDSRLRFSLEIDPVIDVWFGRFPSWWLGLSQYQPLSKRPIDFCHEIGQRFEPVDSSRGFNFATMAGSFDDYVNMPGSTYSSNTSPDGVVNDPTTRTNLRTGSGQNRTSGSYSSNQRSWQPSEHPPSVNQQIRSMGQALTSNLEGGTLNLRVVLDNGISSHVGSQSTGFTNVDGEAKIAPAIAVPGRAKSVWQGKRGAK
ncbi:hypothetical protein VTN77DRAFT_7057 [Rasamsonia byssochlamydoides]|uniref:uncharacterized protein n=1 Tax=Rasamsonia byssochlamydoides TaxID=89139 RepID=UPI003744239E